MDSIIVWIGIVFCLSQSAMFSGLNLAYFSISKLRLEVEKRRGSEQAATVLKLRGDANFLLTTILWGNVGINVLLTLLSNHVLFGVAAFLFSTIFITLLGEILPQAYFSRNALRLAGLLSPILRIYQFLLYPVAKPAALVLDTLLGKEGIPLYSESEIREFIALHIGNENSDIDKVEGIGALNFLKFDDLTVSQEGEHIDPLSIVEISLTEHGPRIPTFKAKAKDGFLQKIHASKKKWVILVDENNEPVYALDSDGFLRDVLLEGPSTEILHYCHRPIVIKDGKTSLEKAIPMLQISPTRGEDDVIDRDIIVLWGEEKKIITGADVLGRLLRGIVSLRI